LLDNHAEDENPPVDMQHKQADQQCVEYVVKYWSLLVAPVQQLENLITSQKHTPTKNYGQSTREIIAQGQHEQLLQLLIAMVPVTKQHS
jgi:hypothetical protein